MSPAVRGDAAESAGRGGQPSPRPPGPAPEAPFSGSLPRPSLAVSTYVRPSSQLVACPGTRQERHCPLPRQSEKPP